MCFIFQIDISNLRTEDEEKEDIPEKESHTCAVCLDVYFNPYMCYPCRHVFCEPCLRTLARDSPSRTPCPLCRTIIAIVRFQTDLSKSSAALFPNEYLKRKQSFQRASCVKWPLPSCNRLFRVFGDSVPWGIYALTPSGICVSDPVDLLPETSQGSIRSSQPYGPLPCGALLIPTVCICHPASR
ncbi:hypothetical protein AB205_0085440 [Aquarana catesbeiana]|uniref:RING-type domain-containing protein n=1 Tax=Aquarana catesbeiana TaxID=8400 RepID=A0A2G9RPV3_AQUCT|nr:hypothetical protein AB205_0085440 [Aquarana catesbeiana]